MRALPQLPWPQQIHREGEGLQPIGNSFYCILDPDDGTDILSRNVDTDLPALAVQ